MDTKLTPQLAKLVVLKCMRETLVKSLDAWDRVEELSIIEKDMVLQATRSQIEQVTATINHQSKVCGVVGSGW